MIESFYIEREKEINENASKYGCIGLEQFLKRSAWEDDINGLGKFYLIKDRKTKMIAAYFGLKAGMISTKDIEASSDEESQLATKREKQRIKTLIEGYMPIRESLPGIELSHFAINDNFRQALSIETGKDIHGLGEYFYPKFIYPIIIDVARKIGVRYLYLYAADNSFDGKLVDYYRKTMQLESLQASKNKRLKPMRSDYDNNCIFMYKVISLNTE